MKPSRLFFIIGCISCIIGFFDNCIASTTLVYVLLSMKFKDDENRKDREDREKHEPQSKSQ